MTENEKQSIGAKPAHRRYALGLPSGSVRALLTLMVLLIVAAQTIAGNKIAPLWIETLMIVLAHYFTSRRFVDLPSDVVRHLEDSGHLERETNPLYLPRHTIRIIIVLIFVALGTMLLISKQVNNESILILLAVVPYVLGIAFKGIRVWLLKRLHRIPSAWWADLKAIVVLGLLAITAFCYLQGKPLDIGSQKITLAAVLFYFGSR